MSHSIQSSLDFKSLDNRGEKPTTTSNLTNTSAPQAAVVDGAIGTAHSPSKDDHTITAATANRWKRQSLPVTDASIDRRDHYHIEPLQVHTAATSASRRNSNIMNTSSNIAPRNKAQYYEEQFQYKDNHYGGARERVHRESPVIAELRTNVIIKDEFTLVTDLSYHLAARYTRPDSSIMINLDHSACLALAGTFDPCYILTISTVANQMQPTTNKRNAALIQTFMADILSVPAERGIVKFVPVPEENFATNGNTLLGEIEQLLKSPDGDSGAKKVLADARKSMPSFKKSVPNMDSSASKPSRTLSTKSVDNRRSVVADSAIPNVFELPAVIDERPSTAHGASSGGLASPQDGLRMNGVSKEDLSAKNMRLANGRPKTIGGKPTEKDIPEPMPTKAKHASSFTPSPQQSKSIQKSNIPISPRPVTQQPPQQQQPPQLARGGSSASVHTLTQSPNKKPEGPKNTYLDNVSTVSAPTSRRHESKSSNGGSPEDMKKSSSGGPGAGWGESGGNKDSAPANTAKRRSTITATPKMPPPPPIPESKAPPKVGKRKSFLSAFRR